MSFGRDLRVLTGRQQPSHSSMVEQPSAYASSATSATSTDDVAELLSQRLSGDGASTSGESGVSGWHPHDPEHLIVNGLGGAFLHPTHVFSPARFVSGTTRTPCLWQRSNPWVLPPFKHPLDQVFHKVPRHIMCAFSSFVLCALFASLPPFLYLADVPFALRPYGTRLP